ncbi:MAG: patatin-like phospholipase family protein [Bacteroidota bacterium]|nr:patatin-like phospholipase family protein [Bacteroidota bacterium]
MKKTILMIIGWMSIISCLNAQKIGLVLSGGGAPGMAHIGIIKALEENHIPIDYIAGTSIGAIVGGMYAMGMTPDEMIRLIKSNDFKNWMSGEVEPEDIYYYRYSDPKPRIIDLRIQINKQKSINFKTRFLPTNFVPPGQINYAFVPLCAQANAAAGGDFDKLMVPFRCVASDVYNKQAVVFRRGVLGDAIRASMTYPFVFKPISIDNKLLFDGGIFNNFPVDIMINDYKPDYIIGSVVAYNPPKADENDLLMQLQNMIITRTDYSLPSSDGLLLKFNLEKINVFDFSRVDELVQMGYDSVMKQLDKIKAKVTRRVTAEEISQRRKDFRNRFPELKFQHVEVTGVDSLQKQYIKRTFQLKKNVFSSNKFKQSYFKLISDDKISEVIPHAVYNSATGLFDLNLNVKTAEQLKVMLGGNISSGISNQAYLGFMFQNLTDCAQTVWIDAQFGKFYNGLGVGTRIDIPSQKEVYLKLALIMHRFDYFTGNSLFYENDRTANFSLNEVYSKLSVGVPLTRKGRMELGVGYGMLTDFYNQSGILFNPTIENDKSTFSMANLFSRIESNTLNNVMYPTKGFNYSASIQLFNGKEDFNPANPTSVSLAKKADLWMQYCVRFDRYFRISSRFTVGTYGELEYSTRELLHNYTITLIQAPAFQPTPYSRTVFNEAFSANQFVAFGLKPVYHITDQLHLRGEAYWFVPYQTFRRAPDNSATYSAPFSTSRFIYETALVYNFRLASAGLFANYNTDHWNVGLNIGILLFNPKFTE